MNCFGTENVFVAIISTTLPAATKPEVPVTKHAVPMAPSHRPRNDAAADVAVLSDLGFFCGIDTRYFPFPWKFHPILLLLRSSSSMSIIIITSEDFGIAVIFA